MIQIIAELGDEHKAVPSFLYNLNRERDKIKK
jgi:hypothetical protein